MCLCAKNGIERRPYHFGQGIILFPTLNQLPVRIQGRVRASALNNKSTLQVYRLATVVKEVALVGNF